MGQKSIKYALLLYKDFTRNEGVVGSNPIFSFIKKVKLTTVNPIYKEFRWFFYIVGMCSYRSQASLHQSNYELVAPLSCGFMKTKMQPPKRKPPIIFNK